MNVLNSRPISKPAGERDPMVGGDTVVAENQIKILTIAETLYQHGQNSLTHFCNRAINF